jgi:IclR helix-turn-helix domain
MNGDQISITLSPAQVDQVVRAASAGRTPGFAVLVSGSVGQDHPDEQRDGDASGEQHERATDGGYFPTLDDRRLSRSLLRGLSVLTCFKGPGEARGIIELAGQLGMSPSTTHRYVTTLVELGLLERCPKSRKYRLAPV